MVEFNFQLEDHEAENFLSIIRDEVVRCRVHAMEVDADATAWYNAHASYLEKLIEKILEGNKRVDGT